MPDYTDKFKDRLEEVEKLSGRAIAKLADHLGIEDKPNPGESWREQAEYVVRAEFKLSGEPIYESDDEDEDEDDKDDEDKDKGSKPLDPPVDVPHSPQRPDPIPSSDSRPSSNPSSSSGSNDSSDDEDDEENIEVYPTKFYKAIDAIIGTDGDILKTDKYGNIING